MSNIVTFFRLIRWKNLALIALGQFLVKQYLDNYITNAAFGRLDFVLLLLSTLLIAAAGYIINDIYDVEVDFINKPKRLIIGKFISLEKANNFYLVLNGLGLALGYYLAIRVGNKSLVTFFLITAALLYFYSISLKKIALLGNIVIALLIGFSLLLVALFAMYEVFQTKGIDLAIPTTIFQVVFYYALFASFINLIRELLKDIIDYEGDKQFNFKTLPVITSIQITKIVSLIITFILIATLCYLDYKVFNANNTILLYSAGLIILLIYFFFRLLEANDKNVYKQHANFLKLIMLYAIFAIVLM